MFVLNFQHKCQWITTYLCVDCLRFVSAWDCLTLTFATVGRKSLLTVKDVNFMSAGGGGRRETMRSINQIDYLPFPDSILLPEVCKLISLLRSLCVPGIVPCFNTFWRAERYISHFVRKFITSRWVSLPSHLAACDITMSRTRIRYGGLRRGGRLNDCCSEGKFSCPCD